MPRWLLCCCPALIDAAALVVATRLNGLDDAEGPDVATKLDGPALIDAAGLVCEYDGAGLRLRLRVAARLCPCNGGTE